MDTNNLNVGVSDRNGFVPGTVDVSVFRLVDGVDAHDGDTCTGNYLVCQISVTGKQQVSGHFSNGHGLRQFLQLQELLVDKLRGLVHDQVGVRPARRGGVLGVVRVVRETLARQLDVVVVQVLEVVQLQRRHVLTVPTHQRQMRGT